MPLQKIKLYIYLLIIRTKRVLLWIECLFLALKLRVSVSYASFPLLPFLKWKITPFSDPALSCSSTLNNSVDVIISLYNFEKYLPVLEKSIESCFYNPKITFHFVVASGTQNEINRIMQLVRGSNHKVHLIPERIGIYAAWNIGIRAGAADFITNLNADDLRLPHSICCQAAHLGNLNADGSYGNFILSNNILTSLNSPPSRALVSSLDDFDKRTLVVKSQNLMHCAPMWRRSLHLRFGYFDDSMQSSGDTEFWLRVMAAGAHFLPYPSITAVYFHNPEGLSTSFTSKGRSEWAQVRDNFLEKQFLGT